MSAWDELREAWRYNTPLYRMTPASRRLFCGLMLAFVALMCVLVAVIA